MSLTPRLTMIGLYNYDNRLFDNLNLPTEINEEDFINNFLLKYGECPVIYPNWGTMQFAIGAWSKKWYHSIERIIYAMTENYNPLHNFDRHEEYDDTEGKETTTGESVETSGTITNDTTVKTLNLTDTSNGSTNGTVENTVSAYNEDTYQPDTKQETGTTTTNTDQHTGTDTTERNAETSGTETRTGTGTEDRTLNHTGHLYGNIGVTESTTMLLHEVELRKNHNIIDIVADMLYKEVCVYVY